MVESSCIHAQLSTNRHFVCNARLEVARQRVCAHTERALAAQIIEDAAVHEQYCRVITPEPAINEETEEVTFLLQQCLDLRYGLSDSCCHRSLHSTHMW